MLETKAKSLDNLDSRMGMFLGFGGVLLKFGLDPTFRTSFCSTDTSVISNRNSLNINT